MMAYDVEKKRIMISRVVRKTYNSRYVIFNITVSNNRFPIIMLIIQGSLCV